MRKRRLLFQHGLCTLLRLRDRHTGLRCSSVVIDFLAAERIDRPSYSISASYLRGNVIPLVHCYTFPSSDVALNSSADKVVQDCSFVGPGHDTVLIDIYSNSKVITQRRGDRYFISQGCTSSCAKLCCFTSSFHRPQWLPPKQKTLNLPGPLCLMQNLAAWWTRFRRASMSPQIYQSVGPCRLNFQRHPLCGPSGMAHGM